ncbi:ABC transporter permease [Methylobacterium nodulans]|uniref:ABC transporter permease n=1 Tax=Methylobacterium nodulans TaxID=114616 RepID=UPI00068065D0|nr:MlaE family lipid ABC transporter permease subunit [Methylobacterium nodulans]
MPESASATLVRFSDGVQARLSGRWTADQAPAVEAAAAGIAASPAGAGRIQIDLSGLSRLDTLGAWVLERTRSEIAAAGRAVEYAGARPEHRILLREVAYREPETAPARRRGLGPVDLLAGLGAGMRQLGAEGLSWLGFLGEVVAACLRVLARPRSFRRAAFVNQMEQIALRGTPIIMLIAFLVGCIVTQQGIIQLQRFGAQSFVVNMIGILTLRELGVLLTAIMVAGRSGSAFTAEIGSMRMREEVDALRVMGLDPIEILIVPRILALMMALPMLGFLADLAALAGGALTSLAYGNLSLDAFLARLQNAVSYRHALVGLIKAPFMALIIGIIATSEGFRVEGSAESLGRHVTASVVKSIFMVIVLDGVFAIFFAAIDL